MQSTSGGQSGLITVAQAAKLLMISEQWVRTLCSKGFIERPKPGFVPLVGAVQGHIRFLKDEERRTSKTAADSRVKDMRADEIALRIEERSGALVREARAEAVAVVDEIAGGLRADLMALPARITPDIALRRRFEDGIDEAFGAASERAARAAGVELSAGSTLGSSKSNDGRQVGAAKSRVPAKRRGARST